jgi:hypothetical protein
MKKYLVTLAYTPDGASSTRGTHVYAHSEFQACQLAQSENPGMYAISAVIV